MKTLNRGKAIRAKCIDCMAGSATEVRRCDIYGCALWPWRMGPGGAEKRKTAAERQVLSNDGAS